MHRALVLGTLLAVLAAGAARAAVPSLAELEQLYAAMEYSRAVAAARALLSRGGSGPRELKRIYELLGNALAIVDRERDAIDSYRRLLALEPDHQVAENVSPKIRRPLTRALTDWAGRPGLSVAHSPPDRAVCDQDLAFTARVVEDPVRMVHAIRVRYRLPGEETESSLKSAAGKGATVLTLSLVSRRASPGQLRYTLEVLDKDGNILARKGQPAAPLVVHLVAAADKHRAGVAPWYKHWWVWTIAGVVVGGVTTAVVVATTREQRSDVGFNYSYKALSW